MNAYIKRRDKSLPRDSNGIWDNISAEPATDAAMSSCVCGPHVGPDPWSTSESTSSRRTRHNGRASPTRSCDECPRYESDSEPASIRATRLQHARIPLVVHMQVPFPTLPVPVRWLHGTLSPMRSAWVRCVSALSCPPRRHERATGSNGLYDIFVDVPSGVSAVRTCSPRLRHLFDAGEHPVLSEPFTVRVSCGVLVARVAGHRDCSTPSW